MGVTRRTRQIVLARCQGRCERCGIFLDPLFYSLQHRRARGMGGSRDPETNGPANLMALCGTATTGCHGFVEANPEESIKNGWRIPQGTTMLESVPVLTYRDWVYFGNRGGLMAVS